MDVDLAGFGDLTAFADETSDPWEILKQDLHARLIEGPGSNPDDEDRGVGITDRLSDAVDPVLIARLVEADFLKDERVTACEAVLTAAGGDGAFELTVTVTSDDQSVVLNFTATAEGVGVSR